MYIIGLMLRKAIKSRSQSRETVEYDKLGNHKIHKNIKGGNLIQSYNKVKDRYMIRIQKLINIANYNILIYFFWINFHFKLIILEI